MCNPLGYDRHYVCVLGSVQELGESLEDVDSSPFLVPAKSLRVLYYEESEHSIETFKLFASQ